MESCYYIRRAHRGSRTFPGFLVTFNRISLALPARFNDGTKRPSFFPSSGNSCWIFLPLPLRLPLSVGLYGLRAALTWGAFEDSETIISPTKKVSGIASKRSPLPLTYCSIISSALCRRICDFVPPKFLFPLLAIRNWPFPCVFWYSISVRPSRNCQLQQHSDANSNWEFQSIEEIFVACPQART